MVMGVGVGEGRVEYGVRGRERREREDRGCSVREDTGVPRHESHLWVRWPILVTDRIQDGRVGKIAAQVSE